MAKVTNSLLGTISGKVGSLLFSHNQYGSNVSAVKQKKKQTDNHANDTIRMFSYEPLPWAMLSWTEQQTWKGFAKDGYNNCRKPSVKKPSGYSVYKSCHTTLTFMENAFLPFTIDYTPGGTTAYTSCNKFPYPVLAPTHQIIPDIRDLSNGVVPINKGIVNVHKNSPFEMQLLFDTAYPAPWNNDLWEDYFQNDFGLALYASKDYPGVASGVFDRYKYLMWYSGMLGSGFGDLQNATSVTIYVDLGTYIYKYWTMAQRQRFFMFSLLMVSRYGTVVKLFEFGDFLRP